MVSERGVAILARIVDATTLGFDGNDVGWSVVMEATGLRIKIDATDVGKSR
jgi:hypothetical protein